MNTRQYYKYCCQTKTVFMKTHIIYWHPNIKISTTLIFTDEKHHRMSGITNNVSTTYRDKMNYRMRVVRSRMNYLKLSLSHVVAEVRRPIGRHRVGGVGWSGPELACLLLLFVFTVPLVHHDCLVRQNNICCF